MKTVIACLVLLVSGCSPAPPQTADYGPAPDYRIYEEQVKAQFEDILVDPESARYSFSSAKKAYISRGLLESSGQTRVGWIIPVRVNAKNRMGGYAGASDFFCFYSAGRVVACREGSYQSHPLVHLTQYQ